MTSSDYFPIHAHSQFSGMDGMGKVEDMAARIAAMGQPGFALTDHGNMGGIVQGYKASRKHGLAFFPGCEFYLVRDVNDQATKGTRYHLGMMALDQEGYEALVKLSTLSWSPDRFYHKPLIDFADLGFLHQDGHSDHIAVTTGCYSSMTVQALIRNGPDAARATIQMLQRWFPHLYVELQDHGIDWGDGWTDKKIADSLYVIAKTVGLPVVMGGDSHYIHAQEQPVHDLMKDICYFGAGEDAHFSGGPYHLLTAAEARSKFPKRTWEDIEAGHSDLLDKHALSLPPLDKYVFQVPAMFKDPNAELRRLTFEGLRDRGLTGTPYSAQASHELDVIAKMGMANYFLLVREHVTEYARANGIIVNTRGSANGSLVCYALNITNTDPLKWNTNFERFLSLDRMKPPDIDVDVDYLGRPQMIAHLRAVFPTMTQVGTYSRIGFSKQKGVEGDIHDDDAKGSIMVQYMAAMGKKDPKFDRKVKKEHWDPLNALAETPVYKSMGTNAAGFILPGDDYPISKFLPQARIISSDTVVTQFNKDDVEAMGYLKIDILGLRALQTLNGTLVSIGRQPNEWDWIPVDDKAACELLRKGKTAGVFQYEGFTQGRGGVEMGIKTTLDAILGLALYRPALINGGQKDLYLANRGKAKSKQVRLHPLFDSVLADTAGVPLYQEQIMQMLQALGMEFKEYNELMTAIKASNGFIANAAETFKRLMPLFYDLCEEKGLDDDESDDAWHAVVGFTEYGFNRAHSTSYGLMAYYAAYLKAHYPFEFMGNLLGVWTGEKEKESEYAAEARRLGYSIVKADVNVSRPEWGIDPQRRNALRKGLASIGGIGFPTAQVIVAERDKNGPYTDIHDFITRLPARPVTGGKDWNRKRELVGVCKILYEAGAFRSMGNA